MLKYCTTFCKNSNATCSVVYGRIPRQSVMNHNSNAGPPNELNKILSKGFKPFKFSFFWIKG